MWKIVWQRNPSNNLKFGKTNEMIDCKPSFVHEVSQRKVCQKSFGNVNPSDNLKFGKANEKIDCNPIFVYEVSQTKVSRKSSTPQINSNLTNGFWTPHSVHRIAFGALTSEMTSLATRACPRSIWSQKPITKRLELRCWTQAPPFSEIAAEKQCC